MSLDENRAVSQINKTMPHQELHTNTVTISQLCCHQQVKNTIDSSLYLLDQDQRVLTAIHDFQDMLDNVS